MPTLESVFHISETGSTWRREVLAGLTTFLAMAYIVFVNPAILSQAGMDFGAVFTATCLSAAFATLVMGLAANYPIALAPGMGQNIFFVSVVAGMGIVWQEALAAVFLSGLAFVALTVSKIRSKLIEAIPDSLKFAIAVGIGLLISLIGLVNAGVLTRGSEGNFGVGDLLSTPSMLALAGLLVTVGLLLRKIRGALLWGMGLSTLLALVAGLIRYEGVFGVPPSLAPTFMKMDLRGVLRWEMAPVVLVFLYMALFDAIGTLVAVGQRAGLMKEGKLLRSERALLADASGTVIGGALGTSTVTAYVESATGVEEGGRTGLANMVTAAMFLVALLCSPLVRMIGGGIEGPAGTTLHPVTAPALLLVGGLMARGLAKIKWGDITEGIPAMLVIVGIPFTWSIADGLGLGFIAWPVLKLISGKAREVPLLVYLLGVIFTARFVLATP